MNFTVDAPMVFNIVSTILMGGGAFMFKRSLHRLDQIVEKIGSHEIRLALLEEKVRRLEQPDRD